MAEPAGVLVTGVAMALPTVLHNATYEWAGVHAKQYFTRHKQLSREPGGRQAQACADRAAHFPASAAGRRRRVTI